MDDVRRDRRVRRGGVGEVCDRAMIGVQIEARGADDESGLNLLDDCSQRVAQAGVSAPRQPRHALIGKCQERRRALPYAEA